MSNKTLGQITLISYALTVILTMTGSYTDVLTPWDMLGTLATYIGFFFTIWGAIRLVKM